jgi:hypothetical protein
VLSWPVLDALTKRPHQWHPIFEYRDFSNSKPPLASSSSTNPRSENLCQYVLRSLCLFNPVALRNYRAPLSPAVYGCNEHSLTYLLYRNGPNHQVRRQEVCRKDRPQRHRRRRRTRIHHPPPQARMLIQFCEVHRWSRGTLGGCSTRPITLAWALTFGYAGIGRKTEESIRLIHWV